MKTNDRMTKQIEFILELDKEKNIFRQTHLTGYRRRENDAEHAWHMAVMAYLLQEYANEEIDIARTMMMCLLHDVVEIDAGDTYAYDEEGKKTQAAREEKAADRIFGLLPEDQQQTLRGIWEEFEAAETMEAKFAHTMDNFQPLLLNDANGGRDWIRHQVERSKVEERQAGSRPGSQQIYQKTEEILDANEEAGHFAGHAKEPACIRRAEKRDIPRVMELLSQVLEIHAALRPDLFLTGTTKYLPEELEAIFLDPSTPVFVAENRDGQVDGYCFCMMQNQPQKTNMPPLKTLYIDDLCVDEKARGTGIAKALYDYVLAYADAQACYDVTFNVWKGNQQAYQFYEKMGMKVKKTQMETILRHDSDGQGSEGHDKR